MLDTSRRGWLRSAAYVALPLTLYLTGLHTEVIGRAQQAMLATGLYKPRLGPPATPAKADFSLALRTLDGRPTTLAQFRGKVILLNIWATWCPPCVAEMPGLQRLQEQLKTDKVVLVLLSVDENPNKAQRFIARRGFTMPVYTLGGELPQVFDSQAIPTTFIISPSGEIVSRHEGMGEYDNPEMLRFLHQLQRQN